MQSKKDSQCCCMIRPTLKFILADALPLGVNFDLVCIAISWNLHLQFTVFSSSASGLLCKSASSFFKSQLFDWEAHRRSHTYCSRRSHASPWHFLNIQLFSTALWVPGQSKLPLLDLYTMFVFTVCRYHNASQYPTWPSTAVSLTCKISNQTEQSTTAPT